MFRFTLLLLALSTMAAADAPRATIADLQEVLGLTSVQVEAIQEVRANLRQEARPVLQELRAAERQLRGQRAADTPDAATISRLEAQITNARGLLDLERSQALAHARSILTPDQTAQLEQFSSANPPNELATLAVQYSLLERPETPAPLSVRPRANQGDFRSDGRRR